MKTSLGERRLEGKMKYEVDSSRTTLSPMWGGEQEWCCIQATRNAWPQPPGAWGKQTGPGPVLSCSQLTSRDLLIRLCPNVPGSRRGREAPGNQGEARSWVQKKGLWVNSGFQEQAVTARIPCGQGSCFVHCCLHVLGI